VFTLAQHWPIPSNRNGFPISCSASTGRKTLIRNGIRPLWLV